MNVWRIFGSVISGGTYTQSSSVGRVTVMEEIVLSRRDDSNPEPVMIQSSGCSIKTLMQILKILQRCVGLMMGGMMVMGGQLVMVMMMMHSAVVETVGSVRVVRNCGGCGSRSGR